MKIVYLGTPDFSVKPLEAILKAGKDEVVAVVCNKDKPVGRKRILTAPPVKLLAQNYGLKVFQYDKISKEGVSDLKLLDADLFITCAFGQILSQEIIDIPKLGVYNIHASLLPKYRGASPIHYAILNGDKTTGITIMKTELGIDTGDILLQKAIDISYEDTCGSLFDKLSDLGSICILEAIDSLRDGKVNLTKQDHSLATLTKMIKREHALIDWNKSAIEIINQIRAFNPAPGAYTILNGEPFKIFSAKLSNRTDDATPGEVLINDKDLVVACGHDAIKLICVQKAGGKPVFIKDFLAGNTINKGIILG
ncbi:MAG: methionyl-tRNA formyltransferase [Clostridia bacterium]|nr:methionyl-tRNA formyltransferase [Clostridia bacterium]